ncbi:twin-arginine translocation signal domain-containing protein [Haloglomus litoreum]|uniref:twin-arginine translocation signal domain-containing protein n=1 Tax=Haloglomus litoreum TaxID=3034026 RepID=UPI0023E7A6AC|nr:twin-arginine translocation signal domain-containing protein [Haloglomus sp. DT116]
MLGRPANDGDTDGATEQHDDRTDERRGPPPERMRTEHATGDGTDSRRAHPSRRSQSRRGFLGGLAGMGIGVGTVTPGPVLQQVEDLLTQVEEEDLPDGTTDAPHDPHTVATFDAIIDAVVPNTQDDPVTGDKVGEPLDDIHQYGGLDADMTGMCIDILNDFMSPEVSLPKVANTGETAPLSQALAAILDVAASELVARGGNEDTPEPGRFGPAGGPFASLSRKDRFRALYDVENRANQLGDGEAQVSETVGIENGRYSRTGSFVVALAVVFPPIVYYSDMNAYDDFIDTAPSERDFDPAEHTSAPEGADTLFGWAQTGYPGITEGHDALLGYELDESFEATGYGKQRSRGPGPRNDSGDDGPDTASDDADGSEGPWGGLLPETPADQFTGGGF